MNSGEANAVLVLELEHGFHAKLLSNNSDRCLALESSYVVIQPFEEEYPKCGEQILETYFEEYLSKKKLDVIVTRFIQKHVGDPFEIINHGKNLPSQSGKRFLEVSNVNVLNKRQVGLETRQQVRRGVGSPEDILCNND
jgi:hypothetical protein